MNQSYTFINNEIVPEDKALLHVSDLSIQRGYGIFDFFKIRDGHVFFLDDYLNRFYNSAEIMRLKVHLQREELKAAIYTLIQKNNLPESGIKMILTGGYSIDGYQTGEPNLIMTQHKLTLPGADQLQKGIKIITHEYVRDFPAAKTINYSMGVWLIDKVLASNAADVLYHRDGIVSEFPRCNFFIVTRHNKVITPLKSVLYGVTRKNVLKLAAKKYKAEEGMITLRDIHQAKEAFLTSTTKRIVPIVKIDDTLIGDGKPGDITLSLLEELKVLEVQDMHLSHSSKN